MRRILSLDFSSGIYLPALDKSAYYSESEVPHLYNERLVLDHP